jgi:hypothetical protein
MTLHECSVRYISDCQCCAGVCYRDKGAETWIATWRLADGSIAGKSFSVKRYGFEEAKELAEKARRNAEVLGLVGGATTRKRRRGQENASSASDTSLSASDTSSE